ncbi:MAG: hypothetical protein M1826_005653 [Phylliscum demangeonii]|nr:MAG: hypothetical protein M1826_005653 [Phylliscum demangeonii]
MLERARTIKGKRERGVTAPHDKHEIEYDEFAEFDHCAAFSPPIYADSPTVLCSFDGATYHISYKGSVCRGCDVAAVRGEGANEGMNEAHRTAMIFSETHVKCL